MIRSPVGLRLENRDDWAFRLALRDAARWGARGILLDATGDLSPDRLSETGRREVRQLLRSVEVSLIGLHLPTRRPFDTLDQLEDRLTRAARAFQMAYELGTRLVLARVGGIPPESEPTRRTTFAMAVRELGRRAEHHGIRLAIETGSDPGSVVAALLEEWDEPGLAASLDPGSLLRSGHDPAAAAVALGRWLAHAYADNAAPPGGQATIAHPRGLGFPPGALDWEEYLGALEEIGYRGFLTFWPEPSADPGPQFQAFLKRIQRF